MAQSFVHDDGAGNRNIERRDAALHGDAEEMVAGFFDEIVEAGAFGAEHEAAVGVEVELGIVRSAAFVEADDPDVGALQLFERAGDVGDAGDGDVLAGPGAGFGHDAGDGRAASLGEQHTVDAGAVGGAEQGAEVVRVFNAVEGEEEAATQFGGSGEKVFEGEEFALAQGGDGSLMGLGAGGAGKLGFVGEGDADAGKFAERGELVQAWCAVAGDEDVFEAAGTGADGLFDRVEAVENFHSTSILDRACNFILR